MTSQTPARSNGFNDGLPLPGPQKKLEWVTPKIFLMDADQASGSGKSDIAPVELNSDSGPS